MRVLVVGSGGREHALVWKLGMSPEITKIYAAPGNGGIRRHAECADIPVTDVEALADFAQAKNIDLTVVGPEAALAAGITDVFEARGLRVFGPTRAAARLESSKIFSKRLMERYGIPTAKFRAFDDPEQAKAYVREHGCPLVIKADGLCAGKGTLMAHTEREAMGAIDLIMVDRIFGPAGDRILIEDFLEGEEVSIIAVTDGKSVIPMVTSQDHKRLLDGDQGPNTGGMGAYAPASVASDETLQHLVSRYVRPTIEAMEREGSPFRGVLYTGFMLTADGPQVLEYNVRFGDPEAQVILPLMETDLLALLDDAVDQRLDTAHVEWKQAYSAVVVLASHGYPGKYSTGVPIEGLEEAAQQEDVWVLHAGTRIEGGRCVTDGGRVLNVVGVGADLPAALQKAYSAIGTVRFNGMLYRKDIGHRALKRAAS